MSPSIQSDLKKLTSSHFYTLFRRCLKIGGEKVLKAWQKQQENLILCFIEKFDMDSIEEEIEEKKKSGDLDDVFKKYCG